MAVVVVVGPPCAGKNYFVDHEFRDGDVVVDYDAIMSGLTRRPPHQHLESAHWLAWDAIGGIYNRLERDGYLTGTAWVITAAPDASRRDRLCQHLKARQLTIDPGRDICLERASVMADAAAWVRAVDTWYSKVIAPRASVRHGGLSYESSETGEGTSNP